MIRSRDRSAVGSRQPATPLAALQEAYLRGVSLMRLSVLLAAMLLALAALLALSRAPWPAPAAAAGLAAASAAAAAVALARLRLRFRGPFVVVTWMRHVGVLDVDGCVADGVEAEGALVRADRTASDRSGAGQDGLIADALAAYASSAELLGRGRGDWAAPLRALAPEVRRASPPLAIALPRRPLSARSYLGLLAVAVAVPAVVGLASIATAPSLPADGDFTLTVAGQSAPADWAARAAGLAAEVDAALPALALRASTPPTGQGTACLAWRPGSALVNVAGAGQEAVSGISADLGGDGQVMVTVTLASGGAYRGLLPADLSAKIRSSLPVPAGLPSGLGW